MDGMQPDTPIRPVTVGLASSLFADSVLNLLRGLLYLALSSLSRLSQLLLGHVLLSAPVVVVQVSVSLSELSAGVDEVAGEEKVVSGCDSKGVSHEGTGIDDESTGHLSRDPNGGKLVVSLAGRSRPGLSYSSGLFCVSIMAARGIPKFDTGPQKSARKCQFTCSHVNFPEAAVFSKH